MTSDTSIVERLYEALVEEVSQNRPELLHESFTVAEIYQNLIPYRTHRERVGAEMNGDYEHALLRLLAGEGGYLTLESDAARERMEEELNSIHPDTGVYRNFAACEVRLRPEALEDRGVTLDLEGPSEEAGEGPSDETEFREQEGLPEAADAEDTARSGSADETHADTAPEGEGGSKTDAAPGAEAASDEEELEGAEGAEGNGSAGTAEVEAEPGSTDEDSGDSPDTCLWCREQLPQREDLRFCPYCGSSVDLRPCPECGAEVESDWIFCIACGTEATA